MKYINKKTNAKVYTKWVFSILYLLMEVRHSNTDIIKYKDTWFK